MQDVILLLTGIIVGVMNSIAGGGMLIGFPVMLATGMSPLVANVTNYFVVIPGQLGAIFGYRNYLRKVPRSYLLLMIPCMLGSAVGATILINTPSDKFSDLVPALLVMAVALFAFQPFLHFHLHRHLKGRAKTALPILLIGLALFPMAIYGGYFGVGLGFVILAFLGFTQIRDVHRINALKNCATLCIAVVAASVVFKTGLVDWREGAFMATGCAIGGYFGSRLAVKSSTHIIRMIVIATGLIAAIYLGSRTY